MAPNMAKPKTADSVNVIFFNMYHRTIHGRMAYKKIFQNYIIFHPILHRIGESVLHLRFYLRLIYSRIRRAANVNMSGSIAKGPRPKALKLKSNCMKGLDEIV